MTTYTRPLMPIGAARANGGSVESPGRTLADSSPFRWSSRQLFGSGQEVQIAHGESVYRLRITSLGKLILTK